VFDDVFMTGITLHFVAKYLTAVGGARQVTGITLARQLFGN